MIAQLIHIYLINVNKFIGNALEYCVLCSMLEDDPNESMIEMVYNL